MTPAPRPIDHPLPMVELGASLDLETAMEIAQARVQVSLQNALPRVVSGHDRLNELINENRHIYGITTGFGPLADRLVPVSQIVSLQQNLINHLATGLGPLFDFATSRAIVLARLQSILQGVSGASAECAALLAAVLNAGLAPAIPSRGTVGASGDLTPLAHVALALQGRGAFLTAEGEKMPGEKALRTHGLTPLSLSHRDGLALVNGTSAMTGVAILNAASTAQLINWSLALTAGYADLMRGRAEAWDSRFAQVRPHPGQMHACTVLSFKIKGSTRIEHQPIAVTVLPKDQTMRGDRAGQDAYTIRCAPQVIGACLDTLAWHDTVVARELNSATDNPIFPADQTPIALHGGNFMGQHVGLASDALNTAIVVLAGLVERQIARLTDERLNGGLPAFLHGGPAGITSGMMGAQVTATAILAEMRARHGAASVQSISTNGANQDVVSMGTIAARKVAENLPDLAHLLGILGMGLVQGRHLLEQAGEAESLAPATRFLADTLRPIAPPMIDDRPLAPDLDRLCAHILSTAPP